MISTYYEAKQILKDNGYRPSELVKDEDVVGLEVSEWAILMREQVAKIRSLLGDAFKVHGNTNHEYIFIQLK